MSISSIFLQRAFLALQERARAAIAAQSKGKKGSKGKSDKVAGPKARADQRPNTAPSAGAKHAVGFNMSEPRGDDSSSNTPHNSVKELIQYRDQRLVMDRSGDSVSQTLMANR